MSHKKIVVTGKANGVDINAALEAALAQAAGSVADEVQTFKVSSIEVVRGGFTGGTESVVTIESAK